ARLSGIDAAVRRVLGEEWPASAAAEEAAELARIAAEAVDPAGRPQGAANAGQSWPEDPHLVLWQALTTLREHRGDGHNAALLQREIGGAAAHVLASAAGRTDREWLMRARGWDEAAWAAAALALAAKLPSIPGTTTDQAALKALAFATSQTGKPYKWAGIGPAAYDCSGLVMTSYQKAGVTTPRVAADQYGFGTSVPLDQARQGDLLFYAMDLTKPATIYHVVMYAGAGKILDAPYTGAFVGTRPLWTQNLLPVAWRPTGLLELPAKPGSTGWTVSQLQAALNRGGAKLTVDGGYGPATAAAVKAWQTAHKLAATGVTDLATWLTLA
ncbi:MAG: SCO6745 family protein, partial [Geminicoccaceae bacterium]